jgi:hypothetical protein
MLLVFDDEDATFEFALIIDGDLLLLIVNVG